MAQRAFPAMALRVMFGKQGRFQVLIEDGVQNECTKCGRSTSQFELVITETGREYFHCNCYSVPTFLHLDEGIVLPRTVYPENTKKLKDWVTAHNRSLKYPPPLIRKPVATQDSPTALALAQCFAFLTVRDILTAELTARDWLHAGWTDALWAAFLKQDGRQVPHSARAEYAQSRRCQCFACKAVVRDDTLGLICPQTNRPLCRACRQTEEMQLVRVDCLCRALGIDPRNAKSELMEKGLQVRGQNVIFWGVGVRKLAEMRKKRRDHLAGILKHDDALGEVMQVALDQPLQEDCMKNAKAKQLSKYFMELKSKGWLAKQISALKVNLSAKKKRKAK